MGRAFRGGALPALLWLGPAAVLACARTPVPPPLLPPPPPVAQPAPEPPPPPPEPAPVVAPEPPPPSPAAPVKVTSIYIPFEVKPPGQVPVSGFVRDRDGGALSGACIELLAADGKIHHPPVFTAGEGSFQFPAVPPGLARITITLDEKRAPDAGNIADHHNQNPRVRILLRPMLVLPPGEAVLVPRIRREGPLDWNGRPARFVETFPLALSRQGYSPACRRALRGGD